MWFRNQRIRSIAATWAEPFQAKEPAEEAVFQLREVCRTAGNGTELFLFLVY